MNAPAHAAAPRKTAFVLAGGGSLGAVQVGMLKALTAHGVKPDLVVGASAGAINGAYLAARPDAEGIAELERLWAVLRSQVETIEQQDVPAFNKLQTTPNANCGISTVPCASPIRITCCSIFVTSTCVCGTQSGSAATATKPIEQPIAPMTARARAIDDVRETRRSGAITIARAPASRCPRTG